MQISSRELVLVLKIILVNLKHDRNFLDVNRARLKLLTLFRVLWIPFRIRCKTQSLLLNVAQAVNISFTDWDSPESSRPAVHTLAACTSMGVLSLPSGFRKKIACTVRNLLNARFRTCFGASSQMIPCEPFHRFNHTMPSCSPSLKIPWDHQLSCYQTIYHLRPPQTSIKQHRCSELLTFCCQKINLRDNMLISSVFQGTRPNGAFIKTL